jgi:MerR family transcriptional regulator, copper efflux regulator
MPWRTPIIEESSMNIGQAARASGISAKMIRYYEAIGLIPKASRSYSGYRNYGEQDIQILVFIRRARTAGFSVARIKKLLSLWSDRKRPAREVKSLAMEHLGELEARIAELRSIADVLSELIRHCHGDDRPECPIIENFAGRGSIDDLSTDPGPRPSGRPLQKT